MSSSDLVTLVVAVLALIGALITAIFHWRGAKGQTDSDRWEMMLQSYDTRIAAAEERASVAEARITALESELLDTGSELLEIRSKSERQSADLERIRVVVRDWFKKIEEQWTTLTDKPMPLPDQEDLDLLEITVTPRNKQRPA